MKKPVSKLGTFLIILATVILAGVAIFTAFRLYQLRQQPVAPNVPSSQPRAQEITPTPNPCSLSFTLTPQGDVTCDSKKVYIAANNTSSITDKTLDFALGDEIQSGGNVAPGQEIIFVIKINETNSGLAYTTSDTVDSKLDYISYASTDNCSVNSTTSTVSCNGTDTGRTNVQTKIKAKVKTAAALGNLVNTATVTVGQQAPTSCNANVNISTSTSTPTPTPTTTPTPTGTPNSCGGTCGSNSNCGSELYCYNGYCRNPSCPSNTDCNCPGTATPTSTASPSSTEASLPQSGTNWPTLMGTGVGILVILGSILLAL